MCSTYFSLSSGSDTMLMHLSSKVLITPSFWCNGWRDVKFQYSSECVFFRYTRSFTVPSSFRVISMSRKGREMPLSSSYVNLTCSVSSCSHPFLTTSITSSTYLFHSFETRSVYIKSRMGRPACQDNWRAEKELAVTELLMKGADGSRNVELVI